MIHGKVPMYGGRKMELKGEPIEEGKYCSCGGAIDKLYLIDSIRQGRCFKCGKLYTIIECNNT